MDSKKNIMSSKFPYSAKVACQGIAGAFSESAAEAIFQKADITYVDRFKDVFEAVDKGLADFGVLPIENSNAGSVIEVYDLFKTYTTANIVRAVKMPVKHFLLGAKNARLEDITEIYTHYMAAKQCAEFLKKYPKIKVNLCANTAEAAKLISLCNKKNIAAIASEKCAAVYNLEVLKENIHDSTSNRTRFICISKECIIYDEADKISIMLSCEHRAGALYEVIKILSDGGLNLVKLESRPKPDSDFEFLFYFDLEGKIKDQHTWNIINKLKNSVPYFLFLGNYREL